MFYFTYIMLTLESSLSITCLCAVELKLLKLVYSFRYMTHIPLEK